MGIDSLRQSVMEEPGINGLGGSMEAVNFLVTETKLKYEPLGVGNIDPETILGELCADYFRTGSALAVWIALLSVSKDVHQVHVGKYNELVKAPGWDPNALDVLKGSVIIPRGDTNKMRVITGFNSKGAILRYFEGDGETDAYKKEKRLEHFCLKERLLRYGDGNLLMEIAHEGREREVFQ